MKLRVIAVPLLSILSAWCLWPQEARKTVPVPLPNDTAETAAKPKAPSAELRAQFWKHQMEFVSALSNCASCQEAKAKVQADLAKIAADCGTPLVFDKDGEPGCQKTLSHPSEKDTDGQKPPAPAAPPVQQ